jgi:hypothetical protein
MRVRVNFSVEFDADQYRTICPDAHMTDAEIRNAIQNLAFAAVEYSLGDNAVAVNMQHNN